MASDISGVTGFIGRQVDAARGNQSPGTGRGRAAAGVPPERPADRADLATFSHAAKLAESVRNVPVVDQGRVRAVRAALSSGTHEFNAERVAEKFLAFERELPGEVT